MRLPQVDDKKEGGDPLMAPNGAPRSASLTAPEDSLETNLEEMEGRRQSAIFILSRWLGQHVLLLATLSGVLIGVATGFLLRPLGLSSDVVHLLSYPGEIFMRLLKLMILPLVITSIIAGTSRLNARMNGKVALRTLVYFAVTSLFNAALGIILVLTIRPGDPGTSEADTESFQGSGLNGAQVLDSLLDLGRNLFTDNLFQAAFQQVHTVYVPKVSPLPILDSTSSPTSDPEDIVLVRSLKHRDGTNTLGLIFFCMLFGTVLGTQGAKAQLVIDFFVNVYEIIMKMVCGIMWITPLGVASVICGKILSVENIGLVMSQIGWFVLTMVIGVFFYQLVILQLIYYVFLRKNPFTFYFGLFHPIITAFATASTAAALPLSLRCMDRLKIDPRVSRFVLPVGCAINMDGTALFIAVASIFVAQMNSMALGWGELATVWLTATAASMSSASVPSAALVLLLMVLATIGAPAEDATLLFAIDWFVDRVRTTNNLLGDCYAAAVVEHLSKTELNLAALEKNAKVSSQDFRSRNGHVPPSDHLVPSVSVDLDIDDHESDLEGATIAVTQTIGSLRNGHVKS